MVRTLTANAETKKDTTLGTVPIILIKVDWSTGTQYYADQDVTSVGISAKAKILDFSQIASQETNGIGEVSSASVLLDDSDGTLKTIVNSVLIENTPVTIYQHFKGNAASDLTILLKGRIISQVTWSEGERTLGFEVETYVEDNEVGYAPSEGDITNMHPNAVDTPWPLGFGTVLKVPAPTCAKLQERKRILFFTYIASLSLLIAIPIGIELVVLGEVDISPGVALAKYSNPGVKDGNPSTIGGK